MVASVPITRALPCSVYAMYTLIVGIASPFSDSLNNVMNLSGHVTALGVCTSGVYALESEPPVSILSAIAIAVIITSVLQLFLILVMISLACPVTRPQIKGWIGWLNFSDTSNGRVGLAKDVLPFWKFEKEVKQRVWQVWWRSQFLDMALQQVQPQEHSDGGDRPATVVTRLIKLEGSAMTKGILPMDSARLRYLLYRASEGADAYWGGSDNVIGAKPRGLHFGKAYLKTDHWRGIYVCFANDSTDLKLLDYPQSPEEASQCRCPIWRTFLRSNFAPQVALKRELRQKLRFLSQIGEAAYFPFSRDEVLFLKNGVVERVESLGSERVVATINYTYATLCVATRRTLSIEDTTLEDVNQDDVAEASGLIVSMKYEDGEGCFTDPHTGQVHQIANRQVVMGPDHIGFMQLCEILKQTQPVWSKGLKERHLKLDNDRRHELHKLQLQEDPVLANAFWRDVYNDHHLPRDELEHYLTTFENNPRLREFPITHREALDDLYNRRQFMYSHPAVTLWYVFWDDLFTSNDDIAALRRLESDLDPRFSTSICYNVLPRAEMETWVTERKLQKLITHELLDLLFTELARRGAVAK